MNLYRILRNGSEKTYADLAFNAKGDQIVSVAGDPDYMLTIWKWKQELILLRSKAFSQDVYSCSFSPTEGVLFTCGMGHIKFWKMSSTFTGLKLQGTIGKFGNSELTDIVAYVQLADGKVLSSTETGNMLLWDGGIIKCELSARGKRPCHAGRIECMILSEAEVITAGEDGYVRVWDLETIDNADVVETGLANAPRIFEMEPMEEILVAKDVKIKSAVRFPNSPHFLIQDQQGQLLKLDTNKRYTDKIFSFHSGIVSGMDTSPLFHKMATIGPDGTLRFFDYRTKATVSKLSYAQGGTAIKWLPPVPFH